MQRSETNEAETPFRFKIYGLVDPRDGSIRYVGRTCNALETRLKGHLGSIGERHTGGSKKKRAWLRELLEVELRPEIRELESFASELDAVEAEERWIKKGLTDGWPLTNGRKSGKGMLSRFGRTERVERHFKEKAKARRALARWQRKQPTPIEMQFVPGAARRLLRTVGRRLGETEINRIAVRCMNAGVAALEDRFGFARNEEGEEPFA